jgi:Mor family transcriptional regulator
MEYLRQKYGLSEDEVYAVLEEVADNAKFG